MEAVVETLPRDTLEAVSDASSSLSVSPKSKGGFITGAGHCLENQRDQIQYPYRRTTQVRSRVACSLTPPG